MSRKKKRLGRPPLKAGKREPVNLTLPPDVLEALGRYGHGNRSGAVTLLTRAEMARRGDPLSAVLVKNALYPAADGLQSVATDNSCKGSDPLHENLPVRLLR